MVVMICDICLLGLVCFRYGIYMMKDMIRNAQVNGGRTLVAAELSVPWHMSTTVLYIVKNDLWKYAFAISSFLNCFALLGESSIAKFQKSNQELEEHKK